MQASLLLKATFQIFIYLRAAGVYCRVAAVERFHVHHSADYISISFGIIELIVFF